MSLLVTNLQLFYNHWIEQNLVSLSLWLFPPNVALIQYNLFVKDNNTLSVKNFNMLNFNVLLFCTLYVPFIFILTRICNFLKIYFLLMRSHMCESMCVLVIICQMCEGAHSSQKRATDPLALELPAGMSCPTLSAETQTPVLRNSKGS